MPAGPRVDRTATHPVAGETYLAEATADERRARYRRLRDTHLGSIELRGVVGEDDESIRVLFDSTRGQMAEFRFELSGEATPRIAGIRVALVSIDAD